VLPGWAARLAVAGSLGLGVGLLLAVLIALANGGAAVAVPLETGGVAGVAERR